ncbi:MAG: hypothetical protein ACFFCW_14340 [Candidatus Hodarchaeota archaeon]
MRHWTAYRLADGAILSKNKNISALSYEDIMKLIPKSMARRTKVLIHKKFPKSYVGIACWPDQKKWYG